jgi:hypothetical protein
VVVFFFSKDYFTNYQYALFDPKKEDFDDTDKVVEPARPRLLTTRFCFIFSLSLFVLSTLAIFWVVGKILPFLLPEETSTKLTSETIVITSALIISGFIPNFPYISQLIDKFRNFFYGLAKIPERAHSIYRALKFTPIKYSEEKISAIIDDQKFRKKISKTDFEPNSSKIEGCWAHITYLIYTIFLWTNDNHFKRYIFDSGLR